MQQALRADPGTSLPGSFHCGSHLEDKIQAFKSSHRAWLSHKVRSNCCSAVLAPRSMGWLCRVSVYRQTSLELDVPCTASDCARLLLVRGSPHAQIPEWQRSISLAFNTLSLQGQAASTQRRRLQSFVPASSQVPFAVPQGPARAPLQVRQSQRMAPLHCMGSAHSGTFMHGCAHDAA